MFNRDFTYGVILTCLLLAVGHWFPWPRRLPRLAAYSYGVASILAGAAVWLLPRGAGDVALGMTLIALAGGLATALCWGIDALLNGWARWRAGHDERDA